jgi:hypothetical protein
MLMGEGQDAAPPQAPPQTAPPQGPPQTLESFAEGLGAKYEKLMQAGEMLSRVRESMDALVALQDVVTPEDVIDQAGKLVSAGLDSSSVVAILAEMPDNSEALQAWVQTQNANVQEREAQLEEVTRDIRHQMGVVGLKMVLKTGAASPGEASPQGPALGMM